MSIYNKKPIENGNQWYHQWFNTSEGREPIFYDVLNKLNGKPVRILEIGTTYEKDDTQAILGAGFSTFYFADYVRQFGGELVTIDINHQAIENAKLMLGDFIRLGVDIKFICDDGIKYITQDPGWDLIYLDAGDNENFSFEAFKLVDRAKTMVLCDDANGWEQGLGKCVKLRKYYQDYQVYTCKNSPHELIFFNTSNIKSPDIEICEDTSRIFLCGITNGPVSKLKPLIDPAKEVFDGLCWTVDDRCSLDVYEYLDNNKGDGKIVSHPFMKAHDWQANQYLYSGAIKPGDWVFICDTSDRIQTAFLNRLRKDISYWEKNGVNTIYLDRPLLFRFWGTQYFHFTPHWALMGAFNKIINLSQTPGYRKENFIINDRDINVSGIEHPIKYFLTYLRSNHCELLYGKFGQGVLNFHESRRQNFLVWWVKTLNKPLEIDAFIEYFKEGIEKKNLHPFVVEYTELEVNIKDLIRYYILKQDFLEEIDKNRFDWSFKKFYYDNIEHQDRDGSYLSDYSKYKIQIGEPLE